MNKKISKSETHYRLAGRLWIEGRDGTFLGYGRVVLLERIGSHGSISGGGPVDVDVVPACVETGRFN